MRPDGMYVWDATWLFMQCGIVRVANAAGVVTRYKRATAVTIQRVATGEIAIGTYVKVGLHDCMIG